MEFSATQRDDGAPGATAAFPYDRMTVERFREGFPRARWRDDLRTWFVPGTTAERRPTAWASRDWSGVLAFDGRGRDAFAFEPITSSYLEVADDLAVRTPYSWSLSLSCGLCPGPGGTRLRNCGAYRSGPPRSCAGAGPPSRRPPAWPSPRSGGRARKAARPLPGRPTAKARAKFLASVRDTFGEGRKTLVGYRNGQPLTKSSALLGTLKRVDGVVQGWGKHYKLYNDEQCFVNLDAELSTLIDDYLGFYGHERHSAPSSHRPAMLGVELLGMQERTSFAWPRSLAAAA